MVCFLDEFSGSLTIPELLVLAHQVDIVTDTTGSKEGSKTGSWLGDSIKKEKLVSNTVSVQGILLVPGQSSHVIQNMHCIGLSIELQHFSNK